MACSDAMIYLTTELGSTERSYEVALGIDGNTKSTIKDMESNAVIFVESNGILSCNETR